MEQEEFTERELREMDREDLISLLLDLQEIINDLSTSTENIG